MAFYSTHISGFSSFCQFDSFFLFSSAFCPFESLFVRYFVRSTFCLFVISSFDTLSFDNLCTRLYRMSRHHANQRSTVIRSLRWLSSSSKHQSSCKIYSRDNNSFGPTIVCVCVWEVLALPRDMSETRLYFTLFKCSIKLTLFYAA